MAADAVAMRLPSGTTLIMHTAIVVSKEILFEKTDSSDDDPYRLSLRKDAYTKFEHIFGSDLVIDYRRFNGAGKEPIPAPRLPTQEVDERLATVLKTAFPTMKPENVTFSSDLGLGGAFVPEVNEILPTRVVINPTTGRGILSAPRSVLTRFVGLQGR